MEQIAARVISNKCICPGTYLLTLHAPEIADQAIAGQFVMVRCDREMVLRRPLSIHTTNDQTLSLLFTVTGNGTSWLSQRIPDETVNLIGPMGNGFYLPANAQRILLVAGGIGIAPLSFLAQQALSQNKTVILLQGAANSEALLPASHLPAITQTLYTTDDGSYGRKGLVTDLLAGYLDNTDKIYTCGPLPMYKTISEITSRCNSDIPVEVSLEVRMGCGMGTCYACSIRTRQGMKRVCLDGPVFNLHDIIWEEVKV